MLILAILILVLGLALAVSGGALKLTVGGVLVVAGVLLYRREQQRRRATPPVPATPKRPFWQRALVGFAGFVCVAAILVAIVFRLTAGLADAADGFFTAARARDLARAKTYLAEDFRASTSDTELQGFFDGSLIARYQSASWSNRSIKNGRGELEGELTSDTGGVMPMKIAFVKEGGVWKIYTLTRPEAGLRAEGEGRPVPDPLEQRRRVRATTRAFAVAVAARDFGDFYHGVSGILQRQTTPAKLAVSMQSFVDSGYDFRSLDKLEPTIDTARIADTGELVLSGSYPLKSPLTFEDRYLYEGIGWKLSGINMHSRPAKDAGT